MPPAVKIKTASGWQDITYAGGPTVYEQTSDPGAVLVGSIWIDTDDSVTSAYTPPIGTVFPGSPFDGQEFVYNCGLGNVGSLWKFRYQSDIPSAWKWVFQGGSPLTHEVDADETTNVVSYTDLSTVGPQQTAPLTGEYLIDFGYQDYCANVSTGTNVFCSPKLGAAAAVDNDGITTSYNTNNTHYSARSRRIRRSLTAADVVKLQYKNGGAGNAGHWRWRWLSLTPVRVLG